MKEIQIRLLSTLFFLAIVCGACANRHESDLNGDKWTKHPCLTIQNPYLTKEYIDERRESGKLMYHVLDTIRVEAPLEVQYLPIQLRMIMSESDFMAQDISAIDPWILLSSGRAMLLGANGEFLNQFGGAYRWLRPDRKRWETGWSSRYRWGHYAATPVEEQVFLRIVMDEATYMTHEDTLSTAAPITGCVIGLPIIVAYPTDMR